MGCDFPMYGYRSPAINPGTGKRSIIFNPMKSVNSHNPILVPCGNCTGCKLEKARTWAIRCHHESRLHNQNAFLTLTYNDQHLPEDYSVHPRELQLFMKRLREYLDRKEEGTKVRFYACGEYGSATLRPHYHILLFGYQFSDLQLHRRGRHGHPIWKSETLSTLWPYGWAYTASVGEQSAGYVARYVMKKQIGDHRACQDIYYTRIHPVYGTFHRVQPEFHLMSRRPGLGADWAKRYKSDYFPSDFVIFNGKKAPVPKFYNSNLTEEELADVKKRRKAHFKTIPESERTNRRRAVKATVRDARIKSLQNRDFLH